MSLLQVITLESGVTAFLAALVLVPLLNRLARKVGWVDSPTWRKLHQGEVPLTGGLAMLLAVLIPTLVYGTLQPPVMGLAMGAALLFLVGFFDDRYPLRARYRFAIQVLVVLAAILANDIRLTHLGQLVGPFTIGLGLLSIPFTVFGMTGVINALNLSDGVDGLAGGLALIAMFWFFWVIYSINKLAYESGSAQLAPMLMAFMGAALGFLVYNLRTPWRRRASIFMGDGGSFMLGFVLAWLAVRTSSIYGKNSLSPVTALWILAIPLFDTVSCILRRMLAGIRPMAPDRKHIHDLLVALGLPVRRAVFALHLAAFIMAWIGVTAWRNKVPDYWMFWSLAALFGLYMVAVLRLWPRFDRGEYKRGLPVPNVLADRQPGA